MGLYSSCTLDPVFPFLGDFPKWKKKVLSVYAMMFVAKLSIKDKGKWNILQQGIIKYITMDLYDWLQGSFQKWRFKTILMKSNIMVLSKKAKQKLCMHLISIYKCIFCFKSPMNI